MQIQLLFNKVLIHPPSVCNILTQTQTSYLQYVDFLLVSLSSNDVSNHTSSCFDEAVGQS